MELLHHPGLIFWKLVTVLFALGVVGSISTVVLFAIELFRVALSKDETDEEYVPKDSIAS